MSAPFWKFRQVIRRRPHPWLASRMNVRPSSHWGRQLSAITEARNEHLKFPALIVHAPKAVIETFERDFGAFRQSRGQWVTTEDVADRHALPEMVWGIVAPRRIVCAFTHTQPLHQR